MKERISLPSDRHSHAGAASIYTTFLRCAIATFLCFYGHWPCVIKTEGMPLLVTIPFHTLITALFPWLWSMIPPLFSRLLLQIASWSSSQVERPISDRRSEHGLVRSDAITHKKQRNRDLCVPSLATVYFRTYINAVSIDVRCWWSCSQLAASQPSCRCSWFALQFLKNYYTRPTHHQEKPWLPRSVKKIFLGQDSRLALSLALLNFLLRLDGILVDQAPNLSNGSFV